jgi:fumarate hydratase class I
MIPNCAATRHTHFTLDGSGSAKLIPPSLSEWPEIVWEIGDTVRKVNLDTVTQDDILTWKPGETLLLSGKMLTGRDAEHKKMIDMLNRGETLPVDLKNRFIYVISH